MTIRVNGEPMEIAGPRTLATLLADLKIDPRRVAVEHNLTIVKRANLDSVVVQGGDEIEIVNFVGGGAPASRLGWRDSPRPRERRRNAKALEQS